MGGLSNKDYSILVSILESPYFGKPPFGYLPMTQAAIDPHDQAAERQRPTNEKKYRHDSSLGQSVHVATKDILRGSHRTTLGPTYSLYSHMDPAVLECKRWLACQNLVAVMVGMV